MGVVWAAVNELVDGEVALKLLQSKNPELRRRLLREAKACGRLAHPNIVKVYDVGETSDGDPFLVMELLRGETLSDRLRRERAFSPSVAVGIAINVARALRAAHNADVIHRDLKPANIFLYRETDDDLDAAIKLKVLDFGVSKLAIENESTATVSGVLLGSPAYMSPEQAQALPIDGRADLWSLGIVLFEMLTGVRPFQSRSMTGVLTELLNKPIQRIDALVPSLDPALCDIVASCLQRNIELRVRRAEDLIDMLRPFSSRDDQPSSWDGAHIALLPPRLPSLPDDLVATTADAPLVAGLPRHDDSEPPDPTSRPGQPDQAALVYEPMLGGNSESQRPTLEMPTRRPSAHTPVPNPSAESSSGGNGATTLASGGSGGNPSAGGLPGTISTLSTTPVSHGPPAARQPITLPPALRRWKIAGNAPLIAISATLGLAIGLAVVFSASGSRDASDSAAASVTASSPPLPSAPAATPLPSLVPDSGEPAPEPTLSASASAKPKAPIAPPRPLNRGSTPVQPPRKPASPKGP